MDLLPKNYPKKKGFQQTNLILNPLKKWVIVVLILFIISVLFAIGLKIYQRTLLSKINKIEKEIGNLEKQKDQTLVDNILVLEKKLIDLKQIFSSHIYSSKLFDLIEKITLPAVQWTDLSLDTKDNILNLEGRAVRWADIAKQIIAFEKEDLRVADVSKLLDEKGINFALKIVISRQLIRK